MITTGIDMRHLSKTTIGAITGALIALAWIVFDTGAVVLLVVLTVAGASIGLVIDQPERLISVLERHKND